jgi:hypothetical protein
VGRLLRVRFSSLITSIGRTNYRVPGTGIDTRRQLARLVVLGGKDNWGHISCYLQPNWA